MIPSYICSEPSSWGCLAIAKPDQKKEVFVMDMIFEANSYNVKPVTLVAGYFFTILSPDPGPFSTERSFKK